MGTEAGPKKQEYLESTDWYKDVVRARLAIEEAVTEDAQNQDDGAGEDTSRFADGVSPDVVYASTHTLDSCERTSWTAYNKAFFSCCNHYAYGKLHVI